MSKTDKYILFIVTSKRCAICDRIKGPTGNIFNLEEEKNRLPFPGGAVWGTDMLKYILEKGDIEVREIIYKDGSGIIDNISNIVYYNYDPENEKISVKDYKKMGKDGRAISIKNDYNDEETVLNIKFSSFINKNIPKCIDRYTLFYPSFIIMHKKEYNSALKDGLCFIKAYSMGCHHVSHGEKWLVSKNEKDFFKPVDPLEKIDKIRSGEIDLTVLPETEKNDVFTIVPSFGSTNNIWTSHRQSDGERPFSSGLDYNIIPDDSNIMFFQKGYDY